MQSFVTKIGIETINANLQFDSERTQEDRHKAWARDIAKFVATTQQQMRVHAHMWELATSSSSSSSSSSADTTSGGGGDEQAIQEEEEEEEEEWKQTCAHLEKFIYLKLHPTLFGRDANVSAADDFFFHRVQTLGFLAPEHFDVKSLGSAAVRDNKEVTCSSEADHDPNPNLNGAEGPNPNPADVFLRVPVSHLRDLELCRTPSDMVACLKSVTLAIATGLKAARGGGGGDPGADELLPMLILALVRAQPKRIHSVLAFLNNYTAAGKMDTEAGYVFCYTIVLPSFLVCDVCVSAVPPSYPSITACLHSLTPHGTTSLTIPLPPSIINEQYSHDLLLQYRYLITSLMSAVQFLDEVDASKLSIAAGDFEANIRRCQEEARAQTQSRQGGGGGGYNYPPEGGSGGRRGGGHVSTTAPTDSNSSRNSSSNSKKGHGGSSTSTPFGTEEEEGAFSLALTATGDGVDGDKALLRLMAKYMSKKTRR
jgi:hypothetical protein